MIVLSSATTGRPAASASETSGWMRTGTGLRLLGCLDHPIRRVVDRDLAVTGLACLSGDSQHLARLDFGAQSGPKRHPDLPAVVPDRDRPRRFFTFGDVLDFADSPFDGRTASRNEVVHRDRCRRAFRVFVVFHGLVLGPPDPGLDL